ncbi:MAG: extracellular solute-binding protein [Anaerolineae bacterium]|nr:MAG: extracellular solute-binding protein [Anaerolineae bacterium]
MRNGPLFRLGIVIVLGLTLAGCGGTTVAQNTELILLEWSGYELPEFWEPFEAQHPEIEPKYSFFAEDTEAFSKAQSGFEFDLIHPCSSYWKLYVDAGLVQPIDTSRLSNWSGVYESLASQGNFDGQQFFIPWEWGYESILVRTDLVEEVPTSWADLWDPQYAGHVAVFDSGESNFVMAASVLGIDPYAATPEQVEQVKQKLLELKPNLLTYWTDYTEINQLVAQGDVWLAGQAWNDAYAALYDEGYEVEYLNPEEGRLGWLCGFGISANSANVDLAYDYINAALDAQSMANMGNAYYYGVANADAVPLLDPYFVELMEMGDPSILNDTVFYQSLTDEQRELFATIWSEVKAGQ